MKRLTKLNKMIDTAVFSDHLGHWCIRPEMVNVEPRSYYGFVYFIVDKKNKKYYIGKKNTVHGGKVYTMRAGKKVQNPTRGKETNWKTYKGSSTDLTKAIRTHKESNFDFFILRFYNTRGGLNHAEANLQQKFDVLTERDKSGERIFYNKSIAAVRWITEEFYDEGF